MDHLSFCHHLLFLEGSHTQVVDNKVCHMDLVRARLAPPWVRLHRESDLLPLESPAEVAQPMWQRLLPANFAQQRLGGKVCLDAH